MSRALDVWLDGSVGETRWALAFEDQPIALRVWRWSEPGRRARWGETYAAQVVRVDAPRRGAFLDLGLAGEGAFLPLDSKGLARRGEGAAALKEGERLRVEVVREAARGKSPVVQWLGPDEGAKLGRLTAAQADVELVAAPPGNRIVRDALDAAFEEAIQTDCPVPGGGRLRIEPTAALVAIDVDALGREGPRDPERLALDLNLAAAREAMRQLRLRNLGGLCAIDFVSMRVQASRRAVEARLREAARGDPWGVQIAPMSRFGVVELSRAQLLTPLHETLNDALGRPSAETLALNALRALEREAASNRGRPLELHLAPDVAAWLDSDRIAWRDALARRIGPRFSLLANPAQPRERFDIRTL